MPHYSGVGNCKNCIAVSPNGQFVYGIDNNDDIVRIDFSHEPINIVKFEFGGGSEWKFDILHIFLLDVDGNYLLLIVRDLYGSNALFAQKVKLDLDTGKYSFFSLARNCAITVPNKTDKQATNETPGVYVNAFQAGDEIFVVKWQNYESLAGGRFGITVFRLRPAGMSGKLSNLSLQSAPGRGRTQNSDSWPLAAFRHTGNKHILLVHRSFRKIMRVYPETEMFEVELQSDNKKRQKRYMNFRKLDVLGASRP